MREITTEIPTQEGLYQVRCFESDNYWEYVAITKDNAGYLLVHDQHFGITDLAAYHDGLTDIHWRRVA